MDKTAMLREVEMRCKEADLPLKNTSKNLVFGKGSAEAEIVFVGEAPGANEDLQGMPFVGAAGKNLDKLLAAVGLSLENVYVANVLKYRPPENRAPLAEEIILHMPWLIEQVKVIRPKVVCCLGNYATKLFLSGFDVELMDKQAGITSLHGQISEIEFDGMKIKLVPLFHPAAIIYNRALLPLWEKDMDVVKELIGK